MYSESNVVLGEKTYTIMITESGCGWREYSKPRFVSGRTFGNFGGLVSFEIDLAAKFASIEAAISDLQDHVSWYHGIRRSVSKRIIETMLRHNDNKCFNITHERL